MCKTTETVKVLIQADLSHTGEPFWKDAKIDACIADIVQALSASGIEMRASCCGHDKSDGNILLQNGREIIIKHAPKAE